MKDKLFTIIIPFILICSFLPVTAEVVNDCQCSAWAETEIKKSELANIVTEELLSNYSDNITRYEFCELMVNTYMEIEEEMPPVYRDIFDDTDSLEVSIAYSLGIVNGVSENEFAPYEPITREQMAVMMGRLAKLVEKADVKENLESFEDYELISDWAIEDMELMVGAGIIKGLDNNNLAPEKNVTREQAIVMTYRLYGYLGGEKIIMMEDTSVDILAELDIVSEDKLSSNENVTVREAFIALDKASGEYSDEIGDLSEWYEGDTLASLDYLDDSDKSLLLGLCGNRRNRILQYEEILNIKLDDNITNYQTLLYVLRMIGDTYGCTDDVALSINGEKEKVYNLACQKGLISSEDAKNADLPIAYRDFCSIIHKALFAEYMIGGDAGVKQVRLIDSLVIEKADAKYPQAVKKEKIISQIPVEAVVNNDLSVEWILPEEYGFINDEKYSAEISVVFQDGNVKGCVIRSFLSKLDGADVVKFIMSSENTELSAIRVSYSDVNADTEYYLDIDVSNIKLVVEGAEVNPGKYIRFKGTWCAKEITLEKSSFEKDCYYLLKSYQKKYRNDKYNKVDHECFRIDKAEETFVAPTNRTFGVSYLDEIHIQKITVTGNSQSGFVLSATPESTNAFLIEESDSSK